MSDSPGGYTLPCLAAPVVSVGIIIIMSSSSSRSISSSSSLVGPCPHADALSPTPTLSPITAAWWGSRWMRAWRRRGACRGRRWRSWCSLRVSWPWSSSPPSSAGWTGEKGGRGGITVAVELGGAGVRGSCLRCG
jgi:hypothetical protein